MFGATTLFELFLFAVKRKGERDGDEEGDREEDEDGEREI